MKAVLLVACFVWCLSPCAKADRIYESSVLTGWAQRGKKAIHYSVHIAYNAPSRERAYLSSGGIKSIVAQYGDQTVVFPPSAFDGSSRDWGTLSYFGYSDYGKCYLLVFFNCGDAAKSYEMEFSIRGSHVVDWHLIPSESSELHDELLRFDRHGKIIYNGPCDRQGNPLRTVR